VKIDAEGVLDLIDFCCLSAVVRVDVYGLVALIRYRIFGKYEECFVPDAEMRARVIE